MTNSKAFTVLGAMLLVFTISGTIVGVGWFLLYLVSIYVPVLQIPLIVVYIILFFWSIFYMGKVS